MSSVYSSETFTSSESPSQPIYTRNGPTLSAVSLVDEVQKNDTHYPGKEHVENQTVRNKQRNQTQLLRMQLLVRLHRQIPPSQSTVINLLVPLGLTLWRQTVVQEELLVFNLRNADDSQSLFHNPHPRLLARTNLLARGCWRVCT